jgi:hypothetical protein
LHYEPARERHLKLFRLFHVFWASNVPIRGKIFLCNLPVCLRFGTSAEELQKAAHRAAVALVELERGGWESGASFRRLGVRELEVRVVSVGERLGEVPCLPVLFRGSGFVEVLEAGTCGFSVEGGLVKRLDGLQLVVERRTCRGFPESVNYVGCSVPEDWVKFARFERVGHFDPSFLVMSGYYFSQGHIEFGGAVSVGTLLSGLFKLWVFACTQTASREMERLVTSVEVFCQYFGGEAVIGRWHQSFRYCIQRPGESIVVPKLVTHMVLTFPDGGNNLCVLLGYEIIDLRNSEGTLRALRQDFAGGVRRTRELSDVECGTAWEETPDNLLHFSAFKLGGGGSVVGSGRRAVGSSEVVLGASLGAGLSGEVMVGGVESSEVVVGASLGAGLSSEVMVGGVESSEAVVGASLGAGLSSEVVVGGRCLEDGVSGVAGSGLTKKILRPSFLIADKKKRKKRIH